MKKIAIGIAAITALIGTFAVASAQSTEAQSTDDILRRLQALEASNAALAKENATLRLENTKLRGRVSEQKGSNETATAQPTSTTSASTLNRTSSKVALYDKASSPMVVKAPPPAPAPVPTWTGFYAGIQVGGGWSDEAVNYSPGDPVFADAIMGTFGFPGEQPLVTNYRISQSGAVGGFEAGYNWQAGSSWVLGLEADFSGSGISGHASGPSVLLNSPSVIFTQTTTADQSTDWYGTVRGRAGWLATPNLLLFGTGGFAYGKVSDSANYRFNGPPGAILVGFPPPPGFSFLCTSGAVCFLGNSSGVRTGWTAGGGLEWLFDQHWSAKIEYQFVDLSTQTVLVTAFNTCPHVIPACAGAAGTSPSFFNAAFHDRFNVVRVGLNYRFW